jgi:uroporphyrin-III C-methyltransferase
MTDLASLPFDFPSFQHGHVWLVGAGPGDPGLLTLLALHALRSADVVVYDALVDPRIVGLARQGATLEHAGKRGGKPSPSQPDISRRLVELAQEGKRVLRLKGGDPFVFGRGAEEAEVLVEAGVPFRVVPGITAGVGGLAYAGIPATARDANSAIAFVTGHDADGAVPDTLDWPALARSVPVLVVYMALTHLEEIAGRLIAAGRRAGRADFPRDDSSPEGDHRPPGGDRPGRPGHRAAGHAGGGRCGDLSRPAGLAECARRGVLTKSKFAWKRVMFPLIGLIAVLALTQVPRLLQFAPQPAPIGGPFTLSDQSGKTADDTDFRGRLMLVYFGYTYCPDVCPTTLNRMMHAYAGLDAGQQAQLAPIFVTVDPERDTVPQMKDYVESFSPALIGLTGTPEQIAAIERGYHVYARKSGTGETYTMDHSSIIYLMGKDGRFLRHFNGDATEQEIADGLKQALRGA